VSTVATHWRRSQPAAAVGPVWVLVAAVIALEIPYPLVHGAARNAITVATVVVFAAASLVHAAATRGACYAAALVTVAGVGGWLVEVLGVHTGVPFGDYSYTGGLGPQAAGVPLVIGAAWLMMAHPAAVVALAAGRRHWSQCAFATVALAGWDVFLDPQMVGAGHWSWRHPAPHLPGVAAVPLTNFAGWLLVAAVVETMLVALARPAGRTADDPMHVAWLWTWASSTLAAAAFFGRPAGALWGCAAMGVTGVPLLRRLRDR
jgi:uncharacterized membrane protein